MQPMVVELEDRGLNAIGVLLGDDLYGGWGIDNMEKTSESFQNLWYSNKYHEVLARSWKEVARIPWEFMI